MMPSISSNPAIQHPLPSAKPDDAWVDAILQFAEPPATAHVLVVADDGLDLLCALIRQGCAAATCIRSESVCREPEPVGVVSIATFGGIAGYTQRDDNQS